MNHLERLIAQYYAWRGYVVRTNVMVGRRDKGGYECELDIVAYHPETEHLVHLEPSLDAHNWAKREERFSKKFAAGKKHIKTQVFPWLEKSPIPIEQIAVLSGSAANHPIVGGGKVINVDAFMAELRQEVGGKGLMSTNAIHEQFDLLRTVQMVVSGYYRVVPDSVTLTKTSLQPKGKKKS